MKLRTLVSTFSFGVLLAASLSCGGSAEIGEACDTPSATDECVDGAICTNESDNAFACRKICTDQADCGANEDCNGISGGSMKSCQPKSG